MILDNIEFHSELGKYIHDAITARVVPDNEEITPEAKVAYFDYLENHIITLFAHILNSVGAKEDIKHLAEYYSDLFKHVANEWIEYKNDGAEH